VYTYLAYVVIIQLSAKIELRFSHSSKLLLKLWIRTIRIVAFLKVKEVAFLTANMIGLPCYLLP
jgi:hypothetical protein